MARTPLALFTYDRPEHTEAVLESLSRCARLDECDLHIYCDGPKNPEQLPAVKASRQVVRKWSALLNAEIIERDTNLGLSRSIVGGVTELCQKYGRVIVIEDDFVLNASFLDYMLQALDRYADEPEVYQVSGYMFPVEHPAQPDAFFLPLTTTWGWATWDRAWRVFNWNASDAWEALRGPKVRKRFDLDNSYPYSGMLEDKLKNQNDSWGILFWWAVFKAGGLVLHPRVSLVWVGGFDGSGTHCQDQLWSRTSPMPEGGWNTGASFSLPDKVLADHAAFDRIKRFLRNERYPSSLTGRLWKKLGRYAERRSRISPG